MMGCSNCWIVIILFVPDPSKWWQLVSEGGTSLQKVNTPPVPTFISMVNYLCSSVRCLQIKSIAGTTLIGHPSIISTPFQMRHNSPRTRPPPPPLKKLSIKKHMCSIPLHFLDFNWPKESNKGRSILQTIVIIIHQLCLTKPIFFWDQPRINCTVQSFH